MTSMFASIRVKDEARTNKYLNTINHNETVETFVHRFLDLVHVFNRRETELHNSVSSNFPKTRSEYFLFTPEITDRQGSLIRNGQKAVHTSAHRDKGTRLAYSADSRRRGE